MENKYKLILPALAICMSISAQDLPQLGKAPVSEIVAAMTLDEKLDLVVGGGYDFMGGISKSVIGYTDKNVPGAAGVTGAISRLGIPETVVADGPAGLRINPTRPGDNKTYYCTGFPVATCIAATWNTDLSEKIGQAMGAEVREYGVDVLLAPAMNIMRNPLCGRNFEYYSEDPILAGKICSSVVNGIQSKGVGTSVKHFAANSQETRRYFTDSRVSARALREIYLRGFRIAVEESQPWTIMTSYNLLNGKYTSQDKDLLTTVLRDEWGFNGMVMTDWNSGDSPAQQIEAGNDLLMPGFGPEKTKIKEAIARGDFEISALDKSVERVLEYIMKTPTFIDRTFSNTPDLKGNAQITRDASAEGAVLLKNENATLPLSASSKNVLLLGNTSYDFIAGGTGSGDVHKAYTVSLVEGLRNAGYSVDANLESFYAKYLQKQKAVAESMQTSSEKFFGKMPKMPEWVPSVSELKSYSKKSDIAVITLGRVSGEGFDRNLEDFNLSESERDLLQKTCKVFHSAGKKVVVVLNIGGVIETASWKDLPDAILLPWQAGQEGGNTVADILCGKVNPSGKLPMSFPNSYADVPSADTFPYDYIPDEDYIMPNPELVGKTCIPNVDYTEYRDGIYVGYRYYDSFGKDVSYPFGYGLSYTSFSYSDLVSSTDGQNITLSVKVTNTGKDSGKEVVQIYVSAPSVDIDKPIHELKAFAKTSNLAPGQSQTLSFRLPANDLASFHENESSWIVSSGEYTVEAGSSSRDIRVTSSVTIPTKVIVERTHNVLNPQNPIIEINPRN